MSTVDYPQSPVDEDRRELLAGATAVAGGLALAGAGVPFVASMWPSERARAAGAPVEVDIGTLALGELKTVEWRGKPVWILRRTPAMISSLEAVRGRLSDPDSQVSSQQPEYARNPTRSIEPELSVPRLAVRSRRPGVQGLAGPHQSRHSAAPRPGRGPARDRARRRQYRGMT